ncbi:hypothetical protein [Microbacterium gorillae]|uniref:hypothetical protein n=1 Tax=Microbacterium gorillae TaxID=1231063 RepID=UPI003D98202F
MPQFQRQRATTNRFSRIIATLAVSAVLVTSGAVAATAATLPQPIPTPAIQTAFEIDGNMSGANDWDGIAATPYGPYTTASGNASTGILDNTSGNDGCTGADASAFPGSQTINTNPWTIAPDTVNNKADLCASGAAYEIVRVDGQQHIILYQYWTRSPDGTGDLTIYQVLEGPLPGRSDDYLIQFDYDSSGGGSISISALSWNGSGWVVNVAGVYYQAAYGQVAATDQTGTFGEMAIDLTASGLLPEDECVSADTGAVLTRTGNSSTAQLQDYFLGSPIELSTCTSLTVTKAGTGFPDNTTFPYIIDQADGATVHDGSLTGTVADTDASPASISAQIGVGETHTWNNVIAQPDYRVAEITSGLPPGVSLDTVVCTYTDLYAPEPNERTAILYENGASTGNTFTLFPSTTGVAPTPSCIITNTATSLTLNKNLVNDHGGTATLADFVLSATPTTGPAVAVLSGTDPSSDPAEGLVGLVAPGSYTLAETNMPGYTASTWSCTGAAFDGATGVVTVQQGENAVCTITNDDIAPRLTLVKEVVNEWGGTAVDTDFTLTATGPVSVSGVEGSAAVTDASVSAGSYVIGEEALAGYELDGITCVGGSFDAASSTLTLASGEVATCTLRNSDLPASLTLIKEVINDNGGLLDVDEVTLTATGPQTITGVTGDAAVTNAQVLAGDYTLSEVAPAGYDPSDWVCSGATLAGDVVTVPVGGNVTCTITNDDIAPLLTLVKEVVNDDGGTAAATDWTLTADGPTPVSGTTGGASVTVAPVSAGEYTLGESGGPAGYAAGAWDCGNADLAGDVLTLGLGESVTCTIVNDDIAPRLTLVKEVINDDGGAAVATEWTLTADGPSTIAGVTGDAAVTDAPVTAGTYALTESGPAGYTAGAWSCDGGALTGSDVILAPGDDVTCTIVNDDQPATLTLVKEVINDDGGQELPTAWTLTANGPTTGVTGVTGDPAITSTPVSAGAYVLSETGPAGYTASEWSCEGGTVVLGVSVIIANGTDVTCTVTNDDVAPRLTLVKEVVNDDGGTAVATDWTLTADGPSTVTGVTGDGAVTDATVIAGTYELTEAGPAGYTAGAWSCVGGTLTGSDVTLAPGDDVTCTIVNDDQPATLTLIKEVSNDDGGEELPTAWTLTATGPTAGVTGVTGDAAITSAPVMAGAYILSETGPSGYAASTWSCEGGTVVLGVSVIVTNGADVTCTVTNDDIAPRLTLVKEVVNDDGGTAVATDWTLTADGPSTATGVTGDDAITDAAVLAGTYALSEAGPAGYTAGDWACDGGALTGSDVTLAPGDVVTCTIVNDDQPATLTLVKEVVNDNGGLIDVGEVTLTATGPQTITGVTGDPAVTNAQVDAGDYTLSEDSPAGYDPSAWVCPGATLANDVVTVPLGGNVTCTITNDDIAPLLTLVKEVVNDGGGTAVATDWTLTADGPTSVSGTTGSASVTAAPVTAGEYTLGESGGPAGYAAGAWDCGNANLTGDVLTLGLGESVTCTIVNDDIAPRLTLVKEVVNDDGGAAVATDWTLTAAGPSTATGVTGDDAITNAAVLAGTYALTESGPDGYNAGDWACVGGTQTGSDVTLAPGDVVTCTIVNDDQPATLTLVKEVINDNGGTAVATDWTLTANGPTAGVTGATGDAAITSTPVSAGAYVLSETGPAGYAASAWSCEGGTVVLGVSVIVTNGADVMCTIVNDDIAPRLTLVKEVINDDGGESTPADWTLTATGENAIAGITGDDAITNAAVLAGTYALTESGPDGYTAGDWTCVGGTQTAADITLAPGDDATCTIINDDQPATLTLIKEVVNDNGGLIEVDEVTLTATGPQTITGITGDPTVTNAQVDAGDYTLSEDSPAGYDPSAWVCPGATLADDVVTVPLGGNVTCTITNDDIAPLLTLVKEVVNDDGGTAVATDWTLTADGPTPVSGTTGSASVTVAPVAAGEYTLSESGGPAGYAAGEWDCANADLTGDVLTLGLGESVTCTIINDDIAPRLTLVKEVINDDGGERTAADWTLTATGESTISGVTGDGAVTDAPVMAGTYELTEAGPAGYTAGAWSCDGGTLTGSDITLAPGDDVTCTIVNDDKPIDLSLDKSDGGLTAEAGTEFVYTITVTNVGQRDMDDDVVTVTDRLPDHLVYVDGPESCTAVDAVVTCDIDPSTLTAGASITLELTVLFDADAPAGTYTNLAYVTTEDDSAPETPTCPEPEARDAGNNVDCTHTPLKPVTNLVGVKSVQEQVDGTWVASDGKAAYGDTIRYVIAVTAGGNANQDDVTVTDTLAAGLIFGASEGCEPSSPCDVTYDAATRQVRAELGTLAPGETATVTFSVTLPAAPKQAAGTTVTAEFDNVAAVSSTQVPPKPTNTVTTTVTRTVPPVVPPAPTRPPLAVTGGTDVLGGVWIALALLVIGAVAVRVRRRIETRR